MKQLITNRDNRISSSKTIQALGFIVLSASLIYCIYLDRSCVPELFNSFALFCGSIAISKKASNAYMYKGKQNE
ncbi:DUF2644 domain-containing protein [Pasteurella skyensis]|uniref:DUF2644 domain-containing protein n=1 Tax=Phocoenobacter skyensis TaxID=97481 RepID=A0AAJ6NBE7_9PAST|nr:DUF2644 domain-containing protein [Pasteurella skyensis]MDP8173681.1 DUF2644 domain-containing protein [Pasteurella skyensis]MDP8178049.1 DUF2644 domain-containing protein [Pasteurella skyensis]